MTATAEVLGFFGPFRCLLNASISLLYINGAGSVPEIRSYLNVAQSQRIIDIFCCQLGPFAMFRKLQGLL